MAIKVKTGPYTGHPIRKARKSFTCGTFRGLIDGQRTFCQTRIEVGDSYVEGDLDPYRAGGFAHEKLCFDCAHVLEAA
jgi:hypothetical protein